MGKSERCIVADVGGEVLDDVASERSATVKKLLPYTRWAKCRRDSRVSHAVLTLPTGAGGPRHREGCPTGGDRDHGSGCEATCGAAGQS